MAWWDWFLRSTTTQVVQTEQVAPPGGGAKSQPAPDSPRVGRYTFESPAVTTESPGASVGGLVDVSAVVREKASARGDRPAFRAADRGVTPLAVPSLRERALEYRLAATRAMPTEPAGTVELWARCVDLEPEDPSAWYAYGHALFEAQRPADAKRALERSLLLGPDDPVTLGALGFVAMRSGEPEAAVVYCGRAAQRSADPETLRGLADAQDAAGLHAEAAATRARLEI